MRDIPFSVRVGRTRYPSLLAAALVVTSGCAIHPPPVDTAPGVDLPPHFEGTTSRATESQAGAAWWTSFGDPELSTLVAKALERNRDLEAAAARVEAALAQARIAGADLSPRLGAGFDAARRRQNFVGFPIPGGDDVLSTTTSTFQADLDISWEADLWGRLRARRSGAKSSFEASRLEYEAARLSLAGQVAKAWFGVVEAEQQVELARQTLDNRRTTRHRLRRRYGAGLASALELRLAISEEAGAEALLAALERHAEAARRRLEILVHRYPDGILDEPRPHVLPPLPAPIPAGTPAELLTRRPDLAAMEARLAASGFGVVEARRALYPRLTLVGSGGSLSDEVKDLLDEDFAIWNLAGGLLAPIFQGGRLRAAVDLAEARRDETLALYVRQILTAFAEVESSLSAERLLSERRAALEGAARQNAQAQELAEQQYAAGLVDYLTVLETQRRALSSRTQLIAAERQLLEARVDLHLALGGGWVAGEPPTAEERSS